MARLTPRRGVPMPKRVILEDQYADPTEEDRAIDATYPEWSGSLQTYLPDPIFFDENGGDR
jgi:hypothetical protein